MKAIASGDKVWQNRGFMPSRPPLKISARSMGQATILDLAGDITLFNSPELRNAMLDQLREKRAGHLIVNMTGVPYVDSSGVASLVEGLKSAREHGARFALFGLSKSAKTVLELTHLLRVFEVHLTEEEAVTSAPPPPFGTAVASGERT
jgi:anti-sigma B factor antagonist